MMSFFLGLLLLSGYRVQKRTERAGLVRPEYGVPVTRFRKCAGLVPPQTQIERQLARELPVILEIEAYIAPPVAEVAGRYGPARFLHRAEQKTCE